MDIYQELYFKLFNKMTDLIVEMQKVQQETENLFISAPCPQPPQGDEPQ